jgi:hypothetical protein
MTLEDARSEAERARDALRFHGAQVKERLQPASLAEDLKIVARKRAIALAGAALANKKARPAVAASAVIAGAAYLLRKPIANLVARRLNKGA